MRKLLFILGILLCSSVIVSSQCPDSLFITTQSQIDSFQINYPGCTEIEGDVIIEYADIDNLNGLSVLTSVGGLLKIAHCNLLTSLTGLDNISIVGGLIISNINLLTNLSGLNNLDSIQGGLQIDQNESLSSLSALENLTSVGSVSIMNNDALTSLSGLDKLTLIGNLGIINNNALTSLSGLDNVTSVEGSLAIRGNLNLKNLTGLNSLTSIGGTLVIGASDPVGAQNSTLTSLTGLENLTSIGQSLVMNCNYSLPNFIGLENLTSIGGSISIGAPSPYLNDSLTSLTGLDNIDAGTISDLTIYNNPNLSICEVKSICDYLAAPNGNVSIHDNGTGCNSQEEVQDSCEAQAGIVDLSIFNDMIIYPNPTHSNISIVFPTQPTKNTSLTLSNTNGKQLITQAITEPQTEIDISSLPTSIYIVKVWNDKEVIVRKVIKQ
jgi:hypothetical protein